MSAICCYPSKIPAPLLPPRKVFLEAALQVLGVAAAVGTVTEWFYRGKKPKTKTDTPTSFEMILQMVEKLWPRSPTSCACTLGRKSWMKPSEAPRRVFPPSSQPHIKLWWAEQPGCYVHACGFPVTEGRLLLRVPRSSDREEGLPLWTSSYGNVEQLRE